MINDALRTILPIAGWPEERTHAIDIIGGADPILPTPFRISETGVAALAAVGLAVSDLWELRTGRRQRIAIDVRQATASLRGGTYLKIDGAAVASGNNPIMGMYPAKHGRWSYIHSNFPNHRSAALKVLGLHAERGKLQGEFGPGLAHGFMLIATLFLLSLGGGQRTDNSLID